MSLGLAISPGNVLPADELAALRPAFLRSILYRLSDLDPMLATGLPLLITLNNEMTVVGGDWSRWDAAVAAVAAKAGDRLMALECGNEFDIWGSPSPEFAADLTKRAAAILRPRGVTVIGTSVASGTWPQWLARYTEAAGDAFDYGCIHPYGQRPAGWGKPGWFHGDLVNVLKSAAAICGRPVACTEYGVKVDDAGGPAQVASFLEAADRTVRELSPDVVGPVAWFAWRDQVGAPGETGGQAFGLVAENGTRRPSWYTFVALPKEDEPMPYTSVWEDPIAAGARFVLGFKDWHDAEPALIGEPHDAEEFGAAHGISQQRTTNGLLTWSDLKSGQVMTFFDARDGRRYRWIGGGSQEIGR